MMSSTVTTSKPLVASNIRAASCLGLVTTRALAGHGARVVMAVRDDERDRRVAADIIVSRPGADLEVRPIDLADLDSVRRFADRMHADDRRVDVLINNAGVMAVPRTLSPQGHEVQFATNHLGHFALTGLLLELRLAQPVERGVWPQLFAATDPAARPGQLVAPGGPAELRGHRAPGKLSAAATDPEHGRRLWELSEQATGVRFGSLRPAGHPSMPMPRILRQEAVGRMVTSGRRPWIADQQQPVV
ncbi:SDR family NAD(P)-dependent oxidoreductase [Micromonospora sp. NPDC050276]|uniref:SDR family NAD(P)-dependent oxidoreductase n=1 Tax=Micromonospora sp. NPDC050276 TaxID=3364278 RepID=UPI00378D9C28